MSGDHSRGDFESPREFILSQGLTLSQTLSNKLK